MVVVLEEVNSDHSAGVAIYISSDSDYTFHDISELFHRSGEYAYSVSTSFFIYSAFSIPSLIAFSSRRLA